MAILRLATGGQISHDDHAGAEDSGGPSFVLVPGMGSTRETYGALAPLLIAGGAARVVAVDLRGMGESDPSKFASFTTTDTARDIVELARALKLQRVVIVGNSMAAACAVAAAADLGADCRGVVMLGAFAWDHPMPFGMGTLLRVMLSCIGASFWADYYKGLFKLPPPGLPAHVARVRANIAAGRVGVLRDHIFAPKLPCAERMPELTARKTPVLAVYGTRDPDFADLKAEAAEMKRRLPDAEIAYVDGAGHYPHMEAPEVVASAVAAWLGRCAPTAL